MNINSVLGKDWISKNYSEETVNYLKDNFSLSEILSRLIAIRNIKMEEVKLFLNPRIKNLLPNPFILKDMEKSADKLVENIISNKKVGIISDYDVDGSTSAAILFATLDNVLLLAIPIETGMPVHFLILFLNSLA